ncbi:MAG: Y-family DNA polymerase [Marinilabiliaceae bacterium]|nr:Y-family DNA polymerase [Marinilabiliaceae bacterium]
MPFGLVDCNNFFVSCERVFRPDLATKPVVVLSNNDGCVVSRSNEAKQMGIPMGMPFFKLREFDVEKRVTPFSSNYTLYADMSHRVMQLLASEVGNIIPYSIDESFFAVDSFANFSHERASQLSAKIQKYTGIPVSVGVAPTMTLAKVACRYAKKVKGYHGACLIDNDVKRQKAIQNIDIGDVWGIGRRSLPRMKAMGIVTAYDYTKLEEVQVKRQFGINGVRTWKELNGISVAKAEEHDTKQSICTSRSFAEMVSAEEQLLTHVSNFAAQCAMKLRQQQSVAQAVTVFVSSNRFRDDMEQYANAATTILDVAASNTPEIVKAAINAMHSIYKKGVSYKKAGVVLSSITPNHAVQTSIFDTASEQRLRNDRLMAVVDKINNKNGRDAVHLASQQPAEVNNIDTQTSLIFNYNLRREHMSKCFTTNFDEIIEVFT